MKYVKYIVLSGMIITIIFFAIGFIKPEVSYSSDIIVNKPLEHSWTVSQDETKMAEWLDGYQKNVHISGTPGEVGAVSDVYFITDGTEMIIRETILNIVQNESMSMKFESDFMNMDYKIMMKSQGKNTKITSETNAVGNGLASKSIMALMSGSIKAQEEINLANLKNVIEKY